MEPIFFENHLIKNLFSSSEICERVFPYLSPEIFENFENQQIVKHFQSFYNTYSKFPSVSEMKLYIENKQVNEAFLKTILLDSSEYNENFMKDQLQEFFRKKLVYKETLKLAEVLSGGKTDEAQEIPDKLREALSFTFDTSIGFDFSKGRDRMYDYLTKIQKSVPTKIHLLDKVTDGGFFNKSFTLFLGASGIGKTTIMSSLMTQIYLQGKKVLYITLEMPEEKIAMKILANIMNIDIKLLKRTPKEVFNKMYDDILGKNSGNIVIREYPAKSMNTNKLRNLLKDLETKKNFKPDIIFVDYIGIMAPNMSSKNGNTYTEGKAISEELAGLASEFDVPIVSAAQTNRKGFSASDLELTDVADSIGMIATSALVIGIIQTEEMKQYNYYTLVVLKNRYGENLRKFTVGIDFSKQRLYNMTDEKDNPLEESEESLFDDSTKELYNEKASKDFIDFGD